jgi:hypothetical protein
MFNGKLWRKSAPPVSHLKIAAGVSRDRAVRLHQQLEKILAAPLDLRINNNKSTLLSVVRPRDGSAPRFSVHRMFLEAPDDVIAALAQYVRRTTPACQAIIRDFMNAQADQDEFDAEIDGSTLAPSSRPLQLRSRGVVYDLHKMAEEVNRDFFGGEAKINISWSRGARETRGGRRRHILFGSYEKQNALVRIHPALDHADVPEFFVKFVIFHEMLHHVLDPKPQPGGRRCVHTPQFKDRERRHPDFRRAMEWERLFMQGKHKA